jgi:hypothetical protein
MAHALRTSVEDFIEGLKSIEQGLITRDLVCDYVNSMRLSAEALKPYIFFNKTITPAISFIATRASRS